MRTIKKTITTQFSPIAVWQVLADFEGVAKWAPGIRRAKLKGEQRTGIGARRQMRHAWGFGIDETVTEWTEGTGYSFVLMKAPFPMRNIRETWSVEDINGQAVITTTVSYNTRVGALGKLFDTVLLHLLVAREMRAGLRGLIGYLEKNVAAGESSSRASDT